MNINARLKSYLKKIIGLVIVAAIFVAIYANQNKPVEYMVYDEVGVYNVIFGPGGNPLKNPSDVAVGLKGEIFVLDSGNKRVVVFAENGQFLYSFSGSRTGLAELIKPVALAIGQDGSVYVSDQERQAVIAFDSKGEYKYSVSDKDSGKLVPNGITVGDDGFVYVFNEYDKKFYVFDTENRKLKPVAQSVNNSFGSCGDICWNDDNGRMLVTDVKNKQVLVTNGYKVFKRWGEEYLSSISGIGYERSQSLLFASDSIRSKIVVFDTSGKYLGEFGSRGDGKGQFSLPEGLAIDQRGKLFVADRGNNRIVVYAFK